MAVWEGSGNVIALDVLRALQREPASFEAFDAELGLAAGLDPRFDDHRARTRTLARGLAGDPAAPVRARQLVADLALGLEASLLLREGPTAVADGFLAARLGEGPASGHLYGALPAGVDVDAIAARA